MIKHQMRITVRQPGKKPINIAEFKKVSLIKRLALKWFGGVERVMVIVPEKSVQSVEIRETSYKKSIGFLKKFLKFLIDGRINLISPLFTKNNKNNITKFACDSPNSS